MEKHKNIDSMTFDTPATIGLCLPWSLKQPFTYLKDVKMCNDLCAPLINYPLTGDLHKSLKWVKTEHLATDHSLYLYGMYEIFNVLCNLPFLWCRSGADFIARRYSIVYYDLNASVTTLTYAGKKQRGAVFF
jgi:hypothetical protein